MTVRPTRAKATLVVAAGLALLKRRSRFWGAIVVPLLMVGAVFTLRRAGEFPQISVPLVWLLLALFVAKASRRDRTSSLRHLNRDVPAGTS